ncbi:MAG: hypothetical protein H6555_05070 [Lewinellaceae bacterium]|nr:hypothetical protein [Lewinellaceae bacterium]
MRINNFQFLDDSEPELNPADSDRILKNVWGNIGMYRMIGQVMDVYVGRLMNTLVDAAAAGDDSVMDSDSRSTRQDPARGPQQDPGKQGPGIPE